MPHTKKDSECETALSVGSVNWMSNVSDGTSVARNNHRGRHEELVKGQSPSRLHRSSDCVFRRLATTHNCLSKKMQVCEVLGFLVPTHATGQLKTASASAGLRSA